MKLVAVFSAPDRPALHREAASYVLQMNGRELFLRMPPDYGIILNPGFIVQLVITPDVIASMREQHRKR